MKRKYSDEEIKNAATEYFRLTKEVKKYKKWDGEMSKLKDEDFIINHLKNIKKYSP